MQEQLTESDVKKIQEEIDYRKKILVVSGNPAVHVQRAVYYCPIYWNLQVDGCYI